MVSVLKLCLVHLPLPNKFRLDGIAWVFNSAVTCAFCLCGCSHGSLLRFFAPGLYAKIRGILNSAQLRLPPWSIYGQRNGQYSLFFTRNYHGIISVVRHELEKFLFTLKCFWYVSILFSNISRP